MADETAEERAQRFRNEGQQDRAKGYGNHEPPHSNLTLLTDNDRQLTQDLADNRAYNAGYSNAAGQAKP
ncbi:MAG: hypothetical protein UY50_C0003G0003 [Parcubacteria group bacterium GW2011_GWA2_49_9]|nr:MAG: hypothetical protein UY50_C0003G0003 [Parcubacteria group bacterium GW2011_GWA2_49_9]